MTHASQRPAPPADTTHRPRVLQGQPAAPQLQLADFGTTIDRHFQVAVWADVELPSGEVVRVEGWWDRERAQVEGLRTSTRCLEAHDPVRRLLEQTNALEGACLKAEARADEAAAEAFYA